MDSRCPQYVKEGFSQIEELAAKGEEGQCCRIQCNSDSHPDLLMCHYMHASSLVSSSYIL